jgi:hypothetical protein
MGTKLKIANKRGVLAAWSDSRSARTQNSSFLTDGGLLWSYGLNIGFTTPQGALIVGDYTSGGGEYHSQTTSTHVGLAKSIADEVMHPEVFKTVLPDIFIPDR